MNLPDMDRALFFLINQGLQNSFFDRIMPFVTTKTALVFLPFVLALCFKEKKNAFPALIAGLLSVLFADASSHIIKDLVMRPRPCNVLDNVNLLVGCGRSWSMPSNHASNAFAFAVTVYIMQRSRLSVLFVAAAALIGISRVFVGVHYPSDVAAGALVGTAAAFGIYGLYGWAKKIYMERRYEQAVYFVLLVMSLVRIYLVLTGPFDLSPDEAHYWEWSRRPDWSYYSKGPIIAWLIGIGTFLFGNTVFGIRILAVIFSALGSVLLFRLGRDLYDERTGFGAAFLLQMVPVFSVFGLLLTIDSPFIFFWILSLYLFNRMIRQKLSEAGRVPAGSWVVLGVVTGLGLLTKYTMAFFLFSAFLYLLFIRDMRPLLKTPGPYIAFAASMLVFSPVIFWNASNEWVTFKHTAGQAHIQAGFVLYWHHFLNFTASQFGVITPLLFVMVVTSLIRLRKTAEGGFLFWFSLPVVVFFILKSFQWKVQANWAMTGYIAGLISFSALYIRRWESMGRLLRATSVAAIALAVLATCILYSPLILKLPEDINPSMKLAGWKQLGDEISAYHENMASKGPVFIFSDRYQIASELAFYMKGNPVTYCVNLGRRMNQYDLWPGFEDLKGRNAIFVMQKERHAIPLYVESAFSKCDLEVIDVLTQKKKPLKFSIAACYDFRGFESHKPETY